ncbi:MAG: hypothetical protein COW03_14815 [Cytophagales bacterium CG12_big_fil_rev_8_21_14_0_65_40_12]|nr:MAG: hypothetical protein COW03_14815 [Cytophagales bacterium CG12_big_fil_rev_8_21_14_0_65_40_12]PIW04245.1 MAG: hypothetical protein COW40_10975 [Cytophagales bacterium CG17_big_fil_post_rev_8_21_14_2_50_40_13]
MKVGFLISDTLSEARLKVLNPVFNDPDFEIVVAILDKRPKLTVKQKLIRNLKKGRGGYVLVMAIERLFAKKTTSVGMLTVDLCIKHEVKVIEARNLYDQGLIEEVRNLKLETLVLLDAFGIIKEPWLSLTPNGILSYHGGDMRKYRGQPSGLWELYNGESEMGVTVQVLAKGLDKGLPVVEKTVSIDKKDRLLDVNQKVAKVSESMLYEALKRLSSPDFEPELINSFGKIYTLPNLRQWIMLNLKIFTRRLFN